MAARQTGFYWGASGHTPEPAVVGAVGPGEHLFRGYQDVISERAEIMGAREPGAGQHAESDPAGRDDRDAGQAAPPLVLSPAPEIEIALGLRLHGLASA
jgi:hypothetical protein